MLAALCLSMSTIHAQRPSTSVAPMPDLMPVVMHHGDLLDLTAEQKTELAKWRKNHHQAQRHLSNEIRRNQADMLKAALEGKPVDELLTYEKAIDAKRVKFITRKAACRDNMKKILSPDQWQKVVKIYREENGIN